jgi:hypothetical protein
MKPKIYTYHDNHFNILEKNYCVYWSMIIDPKAKKIVSDRIGCKFQTFQLN